ncbi:hypothetical protein ABW20_dc0102982 [Dactylellina cionopaga]|nr:hypothetical protein ABW20_dc0102982 [Dactylellina cionopaga]
MRLPPFPSLLLVVLCTVNSATTANTFTSPPSSSTTVTVGTNFDVNWTDLVGDTVDLTLVAGSATDLHTVITIAQDLNNDGDYVWKVPTTLDTGLYALWIVVLGDPESNSYSVEFTIEDPNSDNGAPSGTADGSTPSPTLDSLSSSDTLGPSSTSSPSSSSATTTGPSSSSSSPFSTSPASTTSRSSSSDTTSPPSSSNTSAPSSGLNTGAIAGSVVGGVAVIALIGLAVFWITVREPRKRSAMLQPRMPPPPLEPNNQGIWDGGDVYSSNLKKDTSYMYPGMDLSSQGIGA